MPATLRAGEKKTPGQRRLKAHGAVMFNPVKREINQLENQLRRIERYLIEARSLQLQNQGIDPRRVAAYRAACDHGLEKWLRIYDVLVLIPLDVRTWPEDDS